MNNNEFFNTLKKFFSQEKNVLMAFLFGSSAQNRSCQESDIDIAVYCKKDDKKYFNNLWHALEKMLHKDIDLVNLNATYPSLAFEAIKGKKLNIKDENLFINYMLKVSQEAVDFQEFVIDYWKWKKKLKAA